MMHAAFLEQFYRWLEPFVDWLLAGPKMEWWAGVVEGLHMADAIMLAAMLLVGVGLGGVFVTRRATSPSSADRRASSPPATVRATRASRAGAALPGVVGLVDAMNAELDAMEAERVEALRVADEFSRGLSALSHDVRTPLTRRARLSAAGPRGGDPARKDAQLAAADARLAAMGGLLDELFSYARAADPDTPLELAPVSLRPVLEQVFSATIPSSRRAAGSRSSSATTWSWRPMPRPLRVSPRTLVANALRHGSGALRVTAHPAAEKNHVAVDFANPVADPAAIDADRLFERFYQADPSRATKGSGLGLAVAAELAAAQGMTLAAHVENTELIVTLVMSAV